MRRFGWIVFGLLLLVGGRGQAQTDADGLPYIYYYDDRQAAFVIERIDGTDTRLLGQGVAAEVESTPHGLAIGGPWWAPSGQWLAWTAQPLRFNTNANLPQPYLVNVGDGQAVDLFEGAEAGYMAWSPMEDLLLVATSDLQFEGTPPDDVALWEPISETLTLTLWDMSSVTALQHVQIPLPTERRFAHSVIIEWTDDGQYVMVRYAVTAPSATGAYQSSKLLHVWTRYGEIVRVLEIPSAPDQSFANLLSGQGQLAYAADGMLTVTDLITGNTFSQALDMQDIAYWHWSPDGEYGLLVSGGVWLYDGETLQPVGTGRLPKVGADLSRVWALDGQTALYLDPEADTVYRLDVATGQTVEVATFSDAVDFGWRWLDSEHVLVMEDGFVERRRATIANLATGASTPFSLTDTYFTDFQLSNDGRYLAYISEGPVIYDLETATFTRFSPDPAENFSMSGGEVVWDSTGDWLLIYADKLIAGGGYFRSRGIIHRPTATYRPLPHAQSLGWLPPQVDVQQLPPVEIKRPQPVQVLHGTDWAFYLSWSPSGDQLVSGYNAGLDGDLFRWDMPTMQASAWQAGLTAFQVVEWVNGSTPTLTTLPASPIEGFTLIALSPDGQRAFGTKGEEWVVVEMGTGRELYRSGQPLYDFIAASFSLDGRYLAVARRWGAAQIWDTTNWEVVGETPYAAQGVAFSPDGQYLAASGGWDVYIWRVEDLLN